MVTDETPDADSQPKFCSICGNKLKLDSKFCSTCGSPVKKTEVAGVNPSGTNSGIPESMATPIGTPIGSMTSSTADYGQYRGYSQPYTPMGQPSSSQGIGLPQNILPVKSQLFERSELKIIAFISLFAIISHLLRFLILFNQFPSLKEMLIPIPFYLLVIIVIFGSEKFLLYRKGVKTTIQADYFDYMVSLVFSTFFLTSYSYRSMIDHKLSTVPEKLHQPVHSKMGLSYQEVDKVTYIGQTVRPKIYFLHTIIIILLSTIFLYYYFNPISTDLILTTRLISAYLGGLALANTAPRFGKYNDEMSKVGRYRTLLIFLVSLVVTSVALFGQAFYSTLPGLN